MKNFIITEKFDKKTKLMKSAQYLDTKVEINISGEGCKDNLHRLKVSIHIYYIEKVSIQQQRTE